MASRARGHRPSTPIRAADVALHAFCWLAALLALGCAAWVVGDVLRRGVGSLSWSFITAAPASGGRLGGIAPILVSTAIVLATCMVVVLTVGLAGAIGLSEFHAPDGRGTRLIRLGLDVLAGTPSIAFGLFGYAFFCSWLGLRPSLLVGGLTLACMALPTFVRLAERALRAVPKDTRAAAAALALSDHVRIRRVIVPAAGPGLVAAAGLSLARALAETAALLFTCGYSLRSPESLLDPGRVLSVHVYDLAMNVPGGDGKAYASALVLVAALIGLSAASSCWSYRSARIPWTA